MRVLDLGCHDGFAGAWLREQLGDTLEIDGLELHPHDVDVARDRGYRRVEQARAEDAPHVFDPGSYDAVVCFELVEHVPDPLALLSACESMLRPGGLVFVSTPDGTFGEGHNPHHLRTYRSIDLADQLRRRGQLHEMAVGPDGIVVGAYTPSPRKAEASIYCGPGWERWSPMDIGTRGLGGSETAVVHLARGLADLGWIVTVYGDVEQCAHGDVIYRSHEAFDAMTPVDLLISSRVPELFDRANRAARTMLWVHDIDCGDRLTPHRAARVDDVLCLSGFHLRHVAGRYPFLDGRLRRVRNGVDLDLFKSGNDDCPRSPVVMVTSSPDRGLDLLLELWPQVLDQVPDAQLHHCYAPVYDRVADHDPVIAQHRDRIRELTSQTRNVRNLGHLTQPQLAMAMRGALVWCHPSWATPYDGPFHETSCIGAMEAQAAGLRVITSGWGALPETNATGVQIGGQLGPHATPEQRDTWRNGMVKCIVEGLTNPDVQDHAQRRGPKHARNLTWAPVAERIDRLSRGEMDLPPGLAPAMQSGPAA